MPHLLAIFHRRSLISLAHFRPSMSSIFDAILPQKIRLVLPRRLQRLPRPLLPLRLLPPLLSGEKDMAARPSGEGQPKEELTRSASASRPPATCGLFSGGAGFAISSKCGRQWALLSRCWFFVCGFVIPFAHPPRLSLPTPASFVNFSRPDHVTLIDAEVEALQEEGAIEEVFPSSLGYFSRRWVGVPSSTSNDSTASSSIAPAFTWTR